MFADLCLKYRQNFTNRLSLDFIKIVCPTEACDQIWRNISREKKIAQSLFLLCNIFHHHWSSYSSLPPCLQIFFVSLQKIKIMTYGCILRINHPRHFSFISFQPCATQSRACNSVSSPQRASETPK